MAKAQASQVSTPNWANRTIFEGDNLDILRGMNSASVDLVYLDPPFNSNRDYSAPIGSEAAGAAFKDAWTLSDVDEAWHGEIAERDERLYKVIEAAGLVHGKAMQSYLIFMTVRILELHRVLKPTGSIWLHCDPTASHYLKLVMDSILGKDNFRNEVIWKRTSSRSTERKLPRVHDILLWYAKGEGHKFNKVYGEHDPEYVRKFYRYEDEHGRYRTGDLTAAGVVRDGNSGQPWRGIDPSVIGRHWYGPGTFPSHVEKPIDWENMDTRAKLDFLDANGLIYWPKKQGGVPAFKRYLSTSKGAILTDVITDIPPLSAQSKEKTGYPTQKPLALLERVIRASSNEGNVVLDPFCGCATTCVSAEMLGRQWVGIDLSPLAGKIVVERLQKVSDADGLLKGGKLPKVIHRTDLPRRTDIEELPDYRTHKHVLYGEQEGNCKGCGIHFPFQNMTVDHITPRAKGGGGHKENLQLLCNSCNSRKGSGTQAELIVRLREAGILYRAV